MKQLWNSGFYKNINNYTEATEKVNISSNKYIGSGSDSRRNYSLKKIQPSIYNCIVCELQTMSIYTASSLVGGQSLLHHHPFSSPRVALRKEERLLAA